MTVGAFRRVPIRRRPGRRANVGPGRPHDGGEFRVRLSGTAMSSLGGRDVALRAHDEHPGSPPDFVTGSYPGETGPRFWTHRPGGVHLVAQPGGRPTGSFLDRPNDDAGSWAVRNTGHHWTRRPVSGSAAAALTGRVRCRTLYVNLRRCVSCLTETGCWMSRLGFDEKTTPSGDRHHGPFETRYPTLG